MISNGNLIFGIRNFGIINHSSSDSLELLIENISAVNVKLTEV